MSITLSTLRTKIKNRTQEPNLSNTYIDDALNEAINIIRAEYKIRGARRRATIKIYSDINEYALPVQTGETTTDWDSLVDLQEWWEGSSNRSNFRKLSQPRFAQKDEGHTDGIAEYYKNGDKMLLVNYSPLNADEVILHTCDTYDDNGTWTAGGDASNVTTDENTYIFDAGSVNFDVSGTAAYIEIDDMASVDIDEWENSGAVFVYVYIPDATNVSSLGLRFGSSSSAYWSQSATTQHNGLSFTNGWNLVRFDWNGATETGTVDNTAIDYLRFTVNFSSSTTDTDFRIDNIVFKEGTDMYLEYNSSRWVRNSSGVWKDEFSATTDYFVGTNDESWLIVYEALENLFMTTIKNEEKAEFYGNKRDALLKSIKSRHPEETKQRGTVYYKLEDF